jgi:hypothetical protein
MIKIRHSGGPPRQAEVRENQAFGVAADQHIADRGVDGHIYFYDYTDEGRDAALRRPRVEEKRTSQRDVPTKKLEPIRRKILVQVKGRGLKFASRSAIRWVASGIRSNNPYRKKNIRFGEVKRERLIRLR